MLVNDHPDVIVTIGKVIWGELLKIAQGLQTVYDVADNIIKPLL